MPKTKTNPITAEIIRILPLKKNCYYLIMVPVSAGLSLDTLQTINDELAKEDYNFILVLTKNNEGIEVIERDGVKGVNE